MKKLKNTGTLLSLIAFIILIVAGLVTGCPEEDTDGTNGTNNYAETPTYPMTITDQTGRQITIETEPQKIVSLSPGNTENLFTLGLGDKVVGVTEYCDYPAEALDKPKVGGFSTVDIEKVVEIQPDLILAGDIHTAEIVPALEDYDFKVIVLEPHSLSDVMDTLEIIGKVCNREDEAVQIVGDLEARIQSVTNITSGLTAEQIPDVLYILWHEPVMTVGSDTRIHELIVLAGGNNIAEELGEGYPVISLEAIINANPQVIIAGAGHGTGADASLVFAQEEELLSGVDARVNNRVYGILADIVSRPSARLVDGLEAMAQIIHPEIFGDVPVWQ